MADSPTGRSLTTLELLQARPGITAEQLASRLGVTTRAVRRYVAILREAGVPVDSTSGPHGGYRLGRGVRLPPLLFSTTEALGLVMAVLDGHHAAGDDDDPVGSALGKLLRSLPEPVARQADDLRRATAPAPDRAAARPDLDTASALVSACVERHAVRLAYTSEAGRTSEVDVDPWAVVVRHGRWYLLCWSHHSGPGRDGERRTYRIDRVGAICALDQSFAPPDDLDPVAELEANLAVGWEYDADVVLEASAERTRRLVPRILGRVEPLDDGRSRLRGTTSNAAWYVGQLAALPVAYRVVGGVELREQTELLADRLRASLAPPTA